MKTEALRDQSSQPDSLGSWSENPIWRLYSEYGQGNRRYAILGISSTVLGRIFGLVPAFIIGLTVDAIFLNRRAYRLPLVPVSSIPSTDVTQLYLSIGVLLAATLIGAVASWFENWGWSVFAQRIQRDLRVDAYEQLQHLELAYFTDRRTGDLMSILNNDVNALETFLEDGLSATLWIVATVVGIGLILVGLNVPLTAITLLPIPVLAAFTFLFARLIEPRYLLIREEIGDLNSRLENNVSGIEVIKTEGTEAHEADQVQTASNEYLSANLDAVRMRITYFPGLNIISGAGFAITFLVGGLWVLGRSPLTLSNVLTPGTFVTFVIYAQQFIWPIVRLGNVVDAYERAKAAGGRVHSVMTREPSVRERSDAPPLRVDGGTVEYDGVDFAYADERVLRDVEFSVDGGTTVGVVGPTGAGKSTLLKLLPRLYDVDDGAICVDGQDIRDVTIRSLRRAIGYVSQEPFLFYGTVRENIRYGTFAASDEAVEQAARRAQADAFIQNLPGGYDTLVGERGVKLSGGQRQRLVIARMMLKDPEILVLDEATSAVDTETEALIQESLAEFSRARTTFIISHRLSSVRMADRILVFDDGVLVEDGTHEQLLQSGGLYANFWRVQTGDVKDLPREFLEQALRRQSTIVHDEDEREQDDR